MPRRPAASGEKVAALNKASRGPAPAAVQEVTVTPKVGTIAAEPPTPPRATESVAAGASPAILSAEPPAKRAKTRPHGLPEPVVFLDHDRAKFEHSGTTFRAEPNVEICHNNKDTVMAALMCKPHFINMEE